MGSSVQRSPPSGAELKGGRMLPAAASGTCGGRSRIQNGAIRWVRSITGLLTLRSVEGQRSVPTHAGRPRAVDHRTPSDWLAGHRTDRPEASQMTTSGSERPAGASWRRASNMVFRDRNRSEPSVAIRPNVTSVPISWSFDVDRNRVVARQRKLRKNSVDNRCEPKYTKEALYAV